MFVRNSDTICINVYMFLCNVYVQRVTLNNNGEDGNVVLIMCASVMIPHAL